MPNDEISANQPNVNTDTIATTIKTEPELPRATEPVAANLEKAVEAQPIEAPKAKADNRRQKSAKPSATNVDNTNVSTSDTVQQAAPTAEPSDTPVAKAENKRPARARKPKAEAKPIDLAATGLQLVETKADAPRITAPAETPKPSAPRKAAAWQKKANEDASAEPLVMVETQNK